jgi:hypothetical protein
MLRTDRNRGHQVSAKHSSFGQAPENLLQGLGLSVSNCSAMTYTLPPLNALRAFEGAARHLSFKLAAHELHATPAAVGQQVKALEARPWWKNATDLPDASFFDSAVQSLPKKYFAFSETQISRNVPAVPPRQEGRTRRHERGAGCGGRFGDARRAALEADGKVVWSWRPDAGAKFSRKRFRESDGGKRARSPGRARYKPLKPLRREGRMIRHHLW